MEDTNQIYDFAIKWCYKFRDETINYIELIDHYMADECVEIGFEMDCGHGFEDIYGNAVYDCVELNKVIDDIKDIKLLGSAIYSRWRYFNHWAYHGEEILEAKNRSWFLLALSRLATLSENNAFEFQGTPIKLSLVSNNICRGSCPNPNDEVKQHLTITTKGQVTLLTYKYGDGHGEYTKARSEKFSIDKTATTELLTTVAAYFSNQYSELCATDIGSWIIELTNTQGNTYKFSGALCGDFESERSNISNLIRKTFDMDDLYLFDGNYRTDVINKITIDYQRNSKTKVKEVPQHGKFEFVTWDYSEQLIIDRETKTLDHIRNIGDGCKIFHKYLVDGGIESLLDDFDEEDLFNNVVGNPEDIVETPNDTRDYSITIDYKRKPQRVIKGKYDKNGLPDDFEEFVDAILDFTRFYGLGEILDPSVFGKVKRRKSDYIFCSIIFEEGFKSYYYLTEDDNIEIGNFVFVPVGKDNNEVVVEVIKIEYFNKDNAPLPIEKTKHIIRKCRDAEV